MPTSRASPRSTSSTASSAYSLGKPTSSDGQWTKDRGRRDGKKQGRKDGKKQGRKEGKKKKGRKEGRKNLGRMKDGGERCGARDAYESVEYILRKQAPVDVSDGVAVEGLVVMLRTGSGSPSRNRNLSWWESTIFARVVVA